MSACWYSRCQRLFRSFGLAGCRSRSGICESRCRRSTRLFWATALLKFIAGLFQIDSAVLHLPGAQWEPVGKFTSKLIGDGLVLLTLTCLRRTWLRRHCPPLSCGFDVHHKRACARIARRFVGNHMPRRLFVVFFPAAAALSPRLPKDRTVTPPWACAWQMQPRKGYRLLLGRQIIGRALKSPQTHQTTSATLTRTPRRKHRGYRRGLLYQPAKRARFGVMIDQHLVSRLRRVELASARGRPLPAALAPAVRMFDQAKAPVGSFPGLTV